ncbi:ribosome biogenesis GTPase A [Clostridia bacterium]|nr:ribosome biogenesis GTPase A [Clostridia bacterium]
MCNSDGVKVAMSDIQWFPGHMTKALRGIEADLKTVDAVAEILDARIPEASRNPEIDKIASHKPRVIILNKRDLADPQATALWERHYRELGYAVISCDCASGRGVNRFEGVLKTALADILARRADKGMTGRRVRVMILGIPNTGKSSFINRVAGGRKAAVSDRPGVTRGKQWVVVGKTAELLDTPGVLWHKFDDKQAARLLAYTGAIKDTVVDTEELAADLLEFLTGAGYGEKLTARYGCDVCGGGRDMLASVADRRGFRASGGVLDTLRAAAVVLDEFRGGRIGTITLERPRTEVPRTEVPRTEVPRTTGAV